MANIQISATSNGTDPFLMTINPTIYDAGGGSHYRVNRVDILHGAATWQKVNWDGESRSLIWRGLYVSTPDDTSGFVSQLATMEAWIGEQKFINFGSLENMNDNWPGVSTSWKRCRIINVIKTYMSAEQSGLPRYDSVTLLIQPEE